MRNVIGANMSVLREVLLETGGFREAFGNNKNAKQARTGSKWLHHQAGDEETEFCIRVTQQAPERVWLYTPSAVVRHHVPVQRARWSYFVWRCYDEGLGKARLVKLHGAQSSLSTEKAYVFQVLPAGILGGIADAVLHRQWSGVARAVAIIAGLSMTMTGYAVGSIFSRISNASGRRKLAQ